MKEKATKCYLKTTEVLLNVDEHAGLEISVGHRLETTSVGHGIREKNKNNVSVQA